MNGKNIKSRNRWQSTNVCVNNAWILTMALNVICWPKMTNMEFTYLINNEVFIKEIIPVQKVR
jgi:hypothetical protein